MPDLFKPAALFAIAAGVLAACGQQQEAQSPFPDEAGETALSADDGIDENADAYVFQCGDVTVAARFESAERLAMTAADEDFVLMRVVSGSGAKFQAGDDETTTFWTEGDSARLSLKGTDYPECTLVSEPAL